MQLAWTAYGPPGIRERDGGDPLGFRALAHQLAWEIAPGLTQASDMARGFSLVCLGLEIAHSPAARNAGLDPAETFLRFENLWVLALVHGGFEEQTGFAGVRRAKEMYDALWEFPLTERLLVNQLSAGVWGAYRRSAALFGLIAGRNRRARPDRTKLLGPGRAVAAALREAIVPAGYKLAHYATREWLPVGALDEVQAAPEPGRQEVALVSDAMRSYEGGSGAGGALGRLCDVYHDKGELALARLNIAGLSETQRAAVVLARDLDWLMKHIEKPFRKWMAGQDAELDFDSITEESRWARVGLRPGPHRELRKNLRRRGAMKSVLGHHEQLSRRRGAPPWRLGESLPAIERFVPADFGLSAPAHLFFQGVDPR